MKIKRIEGVLSLTFPPEENLAPFSVSFDSGPLDFKRRYGGKGGSHLIYRAIGSKKCKVLDATAGWCRDAFILASLGCDVTAVEKSSVIYELLCDAKKRGEANLDVAKILERLTIKSGEASDYFDSGWDVIYLDPMFTGVAKKALNKKESQVLQKIACYSSDEELKITVEKALDHAGRVVVKRPLKGTVLVEKPQVQLVSGSTRFDIYRGKFESKEAHS